MFAKTASRTASVTSRSSRVAAAQGIQRSLHLHHGRAFVRPFSLSNVRSFATHVEKIVSFGAETVSEGTVYEWNKKVGDWVEKDEVLCSIETDKVRMDLRATASGKVEWAKEAGSKLLVGAEVAKIDTSAAKPVGAPAAKPDGAAPKPAPAAPAAPSSSPAAPRPAAPAPAAPPAPAPKAAPAAAPAAPGGKKGKDVKGGDKGAEKESAPSALDDVAFAPVYTYPTATRTEQRKPFSPFAAAAAATMKVPVVLRNTETMSFAQIEAAVAALGERARNGQLAIEDMAAGTFAINSSGVLGAMMGTSMIPPGCSATLGINAVRKRAIAVGDKMESRPVMFVSLSYDHRIIDGAQAVTFLKTIKEAIEDPHRLLLNL